MVRIRINIFGDAVVIKYRLNTVPAREETFDIKIVVPYNDC